VSAHDRRRRKWFVRQKPTRIAGKFLGGCFLLLCLTTKGAEPPIFFKGMTVSAQTWGIEWETPAMMKTLDELKSLGVNSVAIHPYAQIQNDGHVTFREMDNDRYITAPLDWAHERGLSVMLIPHIAYWGSKFLWRGEIDFQTTEEWDRFFNDYEVWIVKMARIAQEHHAAVFCVGLEFTHAQKFEQRWRKIIAAVRAVYGGKLTYGGNWDSFEEVKFWDALDYIGVLAYFPLTSVSYPGEADIAIAWEKRCAALQTYSRGHENKKILFVEIGYNDSARAAAEPWAFKTGGEHADEIQQRCIAVALDLPKLCPVLAGMFWWKWFPDLPSLEEENYRLQTPAVKALFVKHWR
jgi:hypothetical protein